MLINQIKQELRCLSWDKIKRVGPKIKASYQKLLPAFKNIWYSWKHEVRSPTYPQSCAIEIEITKFIRNFEITNSYLLPNSTVNGIWGGVVARFFRETYWRILCIWFLAMLRTFYWLTLKKYVKAQAAPRDLFSTGGERGFLSISQRFFNICSWYLYGDTKSLSISSGRHQKFDYMCSI